MSRKHWLAAYGEKIPCEVNPDAYASVVEMLEAAMARFADRPAFAASDTRSPMRIRIGCRAISRPTCRRSAA